jgi:hypothetical protein
MDTYSHLIDGMCGDAVDGLEEMSSVLSLFRRTENGCLEQRLFSPW